MVSSHCGHYYAQPRLDPSKDRRQQLRTSHQLHHQLASREPASTLGHSSGASPRTGCCTEATSRSSSPARNRLTTWASSSASASGPARSSTDNSPAAAAITPSPVGIYETHP